MGAAGPEPSSRLRSEVVVVRSARRAESSASRTVTTGTRACGPCQGGWYKRRYGVAHVRATGTVWCGPCQGDERTGWCGRSYVRQHVPHVREISTTAYALCQGDKRVGNWY
eukprot:2746764-Rhodomonas_salina.3